MYKGFYNLTSGILTQQRVLNTVSNNMTNTYTPGFKRDVMATSTFKDWITYRTGNMDKSGTASLGGSQSMIRTVTENVTIYEQGALDYTNRIFDFALQGPGFFQIETPDGLQYTRNGSFTLDDEGYLYLQDAGRVMGTNGPIRLGTDKFTVDRMGNIYLDETGALAGRILVCDFEDYNAIDKFGEGMFITDQAPITNPVGTQVTWQALEGSNVNIMDEMVNMMTAQRALQSAAQMLQIYDQINSRAVNDLGRV